MKFLSLLPETDNYILMATIGKVAAGEPQEIECALERIDLNRFVTNGNEDCFMIPVDGDSMEGEIKSGDWVIVDRGAEPQKGDIILACVGNSYTVKYFEPSRNGLRLIASNGNYAAREVTPKDDFEIFGVVVGVYHPVRKRGKKI